MGATRGPGKLLDIAKETGVSGDYLNALEILEVSVQEVVNKPLVMNVSAVIAAVLGEAGVPASLMRGIVLIARCAGLVGHLYEDMNNPIGARPVVRGTEEYRLPGLICWPRQGSHGSFYPFLYFPGNLRRLFPLGLNIGAPMTIRMAPGHFRKLLRGHR